MFIFNKLTFKFLFYAFLAWTIINVLGSTMEMNVIHKSNWLIRQAARDTLHSEQYYHQSLRCALRSKNNNQIALAYKYIGNFYWSNFRNEIYRYYYFNGLKYLNKTSISLTKSKLLLNIALISEHKGQYDSVIYYGNLAMKANPAWAAQQQINIYQTIGNAYFISGRYTKALFYYLSIYADLEQKENQVTYHETINNIASCYTRLKQTSKALSFYKRALKLKYAYTDSILFAETYHGIGKILHLNRQYDSALAYQVKAHAIFLKKNDILGQFNTLNEAGTLLSKRDKNQGESYLLKALKLAHQISDPYLLANSYTAFGILYEERKDYPRAVDYLQKAFQISDSLQLNDINLSITYHLSRCLFALHRLEEAYHMYEKYTTCLNFSFEQKKSITEAEEWFSSYNEQKLELIKEQSSYQLRLIALMMFCISLVMIGLVYRRLNRSRIHELKNYQANLTTILENLQEGIIGIGPDGKVLYFNALLADYLGCRQPSGQSQTIRQYLFSNTKLESDFFKYFEDSLISGEQCFEFQRTINDQSHHFQATFRRFQFFNQQQENAHFGVVVVIRDVTDAINHQQIQSQYQLSMLKSTIDGQEKERKRIAQDLHDSLAQLISGIKMQVEMLAAETAPQSAYVSKLINSIKENCQHATLEIKVIAYNLIPHDLEEFGLIYCLEQLCNRISEISQIPIEFETNLPFEYLFDETEKLSLYRIAQEALNNAVKHAQANNIRLTLLCNEDSEQLILTISDDGIGFVAGNHRTGMGFNTMQSRTKLLNGELNFFQDSGYTVVEAVFPLRLTFNPLSPTE
jgi:signal transduction histidine kinase